MGQPEQRALIDAMHCAKLALERGMGGALYAPSSYFMKRPPEQYADDVARAKVGTCIAGSDHHGQPGFEPVLSQPTGI